MLSKQRARYSRAPWTVITTAVLGLLACATTPANLRTAEGTNCEVTLERAGALPRTAASSTAGAAIKLLLPPSSLGVPLKKLPATAEWLHKQTESSKESLRPMLTRELCGILATRHLSCLATLPWFSTQEESSLWELKRLQRWVRC